MQTQAHAQSIEACRALVGDGIALDIGTGVEVMDNGGITATWADDSVTDAVGDEQGGQYIDVLFVGVHFSI